MGDLGDGAYTGCCVPFWRCPHLWWCLWCHVLASWRFIWVLVKTSRSSQNAIRGLGLSRAFILCTSLGNIRPGLSQVSSSTLDGTLLRTGTPWLPAVLSLMLSLWRMPTLFQHTIFLSLENSRIFGRTFLVRILVVLSFHFLSSGRSRHLH